MTLPEARVLYELAHADRTLASDLQISLGMDAGHVIRLVARFERKGWIDRHREEDDGRRRPITLTLKGRDAFAVLDGLQRADVERKVEGLNAGQRADLAEALRRVRDLLGSGGQRSFSLRTFAPGDFGLIAARQAIIYRESNGWHEKLEVNVWETAFAFLKAFKPGREQCWVAEVDGRLAGSATVYAG